MNNKVKFLRGTSNEYAVAEKDGDAIYFTTDDGKLYIGDKEISGTGGLTIDDTLSDTSTNPVQNKVVKQAIDNKADKTTATKDTDGLMSAEDKSKLDSVDDTYALKSKYGDTTINVGRKAETTVGNYSTAEGLSTTASGTSSHAEGGSTTASGTCSHAEGSNCSASQTSIPDRTVTISDVDYTIIGSNAYGINSHAEGTQSFAYGYSSHAEGYRTTASGNDSHAEGYGTTASGHYSHTSGYHTKALHDNEAAYGKYNESNDNTLFSIGDGTADDARHNAFEITTTGGKLHDKDIATTDLIPTELPANGGNADTVDGLHADDFVNASNMNSIQIPSNVDVPVWIHTYGKRYQQYMTNGTNIGTTNIPNDSTDYVWYWYDGVNIIAREWTTGKYYICDTINGGFSGWKDVYTSGYKPYVTGEVGSSDGRFITNHGFLPSRVLIWSKGSTYGGSAIYSVNTFDESGFTIAAGAGIPAYDKYEYMIFR